VVVNIAGDDLRALAVHLVGPAEIAARLNIDANTVNVWKVRHADFPRPVRKLRLGEIWDLREVVVWAERTGRLPSRSESAAEPNDA
jgi:hypothetical protein